MPLPLRLLILPLIGLLCLSAAAQPVEYDDEEPAGASVREAAVAERVADYVAAGVTQVYYAVNRQPVLRAGPGVGSSLGQLAFRRGVRVVAAEGPWRLVYDIESGERLGWVEHRALSNLWLLIDKAGREMFVYQGTELFRRLPIDVSINPDGHKVRRAQRGETYHYRIPEGNYFVSSKNPNSQYYLSFMLNYPNVRDANQGLSSGLITPAQHRAIINAAEQFRTPPFSTALGGAIAIHGQGSGRQRAWTRGCVALRDVHMDLLWNMVQVGTPVLIR